MLNSVDETGATDHLVAWDLGLWLGGKPQGWRLDDDAVVRSDNEIDHVDLVVQPDPAVVLVDRGHTSPRPAQTPNQRRRGTLRR